MDDDLGALTFRLQEDLVFTSLQRLTSGQPAQDCMCSQQQRLVLETYIWSRVLTAAIECHLGNHMAELLWKHTGNKGRTKCLGQVRWPCFYEAFARIELSGFILSSVALQVLLLLFNWCLKRDMHVYLCTWYWILAKRVSTHAIIDAGAGQMAGGFQSCRPRGRPDL